MPAAALNGITINYEVHGEGTPLVLAHGYTASLNMWAAQVPAFAAKYRVVTYDTRGHGGTTAPADIEQYGLARDYVADQVALMDHLGIDSAYVGGLSMGGMIAQEFALQHPARVKALLLFDTGAGGSAFGDPARREQFAKMRTMMQGLARSGGMSAIIEAMRNSPAAMGRGDGPVPDGVRDHVRNMSTMSVDGYLGGAASMGGWAGTAGRLHEITAPTLVLCGENDALLPAGRLIHDRIRGSRFVVVRDAGHGTALWRPDAFTQATLAFLADVDAGRPVAGAIEV